MATISETLYHNYYQIRREVSQPADLATLLLARLRYEPPARLPSQLSELISRLETGSLGVLSGDGANNFSRWLYHNYLVVNKTVKGVSFYPLHPALSLPGNGEGVRVTKFIETLAGAFTPAERDTLVNSLWSDEALPAFEQALYNLVEWELGGQAVASPPAAGRFSGGQDAAPALSPAGILARTKEDLLALVQVTTGVQSYVTHAGRLLAFALARYLLAQAGLTFDLPIYAAPAADSHPGVKTLAHEIIEVHRAQFEQALQRQFKEALNKAVSQAGYNDRSLTEDAARKLSKQLFDPNSRLVTKDRFDRGKQEQDSFADIAYHYYWSHSGARSRFLRQLHATHLNMAKKAGFANSRSRYSQWHFYWLAPPLVETLLLVSQSRLNVSRLLVVKLLEDWRDRYGLAILVDPTWEDVYRQQFRSLGSPEALNEANQRRFTEILAERGRLYKNSDDFPWVILRD
jgi:hypothetical protein